jgi:hypothetical protein
MIRLSEWGMLYLQTNMMACHAIREHSTLTANSKFWFPIEINAVCHGGCNLPHGTL